MFELEDNVEIPEGLRPGQSKYPFQDMQVGHSFFVPGETLQGKARKAASVYQSRHGIKFKAMLVDGGVRIWRVA